MESQSRPRRQCKKCPWRKDVDPFDIPNGYCPTKHANLASTIADPGSTRGLGGGVQAMACHESPPGREVSCVGWLANQLGPGNNLALRLMAMSGKVDTNYELVGEQHKRFEDTLPRKKRRAR